MKVGRFGGIASVQRVHELCVSRRVPMWCGGMLETGIGRAHNIHLATMPGFVYPGDTASASRTYAKDVVEQQLEATDGIMPVPDGPGIGVTLDRPFLETRHALGRGARPDERRAGRAARARHGRRARRSSRRSSTGCGAAQDAVSVNMLVATLVEGGMALGAFDGERIVGAVYGFPTARAARAALPLHGGRPRLPPARPRGPTEAARSATGASTTATPRCGGPSTRCSSPTRTSTCACSAPSGISYHPDHYGTLGGINGSLPSDRVTVQWELDVGAPARRRRRAHRRGAGARCRRDRRRRRPLRTRRDSRCGWRSHRRCAPAGGWSTSTSTVRQYALVAP